ncbi:MAG: bifunctional glutamate N-acetyltransferase/amino-acid acetyltransferase ArgJ [Candidatus Obscuribacterales bacterium]|nr:bifunctional glutamate N-acetyltransferase/amino-acid acetyltransferase ArgJ [Candidatus Obscuribacterales bacterium]
MKIVSGGVTAPKGFKAAGAHVGLKRKRKDLAILLSDVDATVAGVFTTNVVKGAPVIWTQKVTSNDSPIRAVVVNSGHANSCTGPQGYQHCVQMAESAAKAIGIAPEEVAIASTGFIGVPIPIDKIVAGLPVVASMLNSSLSAGTSAAEAIRTTDQFTKETAIQLELNGKVVTIGGMAKGSGMVHPNMATMLAFITSDINISKELLLAALKESVATTYNMISVDGDTSTNDMAIAMCNGLAGNTSIVDRDDESYQLFVQALHSINENLAKAVARDGEGATKFVEVSIVGGECAEDAQKLAKSVVSSSLVKTALFGQDANWGRVMAALGKGGVLFDPARLSIGFESEAGVLALMECGTPLSVDSHAARKVLSEKDIRINIDLMAGASAARAWGCDLSYDYVRINGAYRP